MKNKHKIKRLKNSIKILIIIVTTILSSGTIFQTHAASLLERIRIELEGIYLSQYFSKVHFNVGGNDFGGGFIWLPVQNKKSKERATLSVSGTSNTLTCATQVRGFYYNSQRGERLRPLDETSLGYLTGMGATGYENLHMTGGLYTNCGTLEKIGTNLSTSGDVLGIYGFLQYTLGDEKSGLIAGVDYDAERNIIKSGANFQCNLQRLNNSYPFGYIYDDHGHMGLVGAKINSTYMTSYTTVSDFHNKLNTNGFQGNKCISTYFGYDGETIIQKDAIPNFGMVASNFFDFGKGNAKTTIFTLGIKGIVGLTEELTDDQKTFFEQNQMSSTLLLRTESNIADIVNKAYKKAEILCRGKWINHRPSDNRDLICLKMDTNGKKELKECIGGITCTPNNFANKTVIVKEGNVYLNVSQKNTATINLFIEKGNLFLVNSGSSQTFFDNKGYLTNCIEQNGVRNCIEGNYLKGNFIINGLVLPTDSTTRIDPIPLKNRLIIHGKLVSFNSLLEPSETRINAITEVLDNYYDDKYKNYIAFPNLFEWKCNGAEGIATDGTRCRGYITNDDLTLVDKAFGIIDMDISSKLD